ncbi:MAG TPA: MgtC/SapB family protein [Candidatus Krumholzibacteria bacterium]|nr:MgtC/SapB family protein [Candidatus Krumholzibacteria bacterium]
MNSFSPFELAFWTPVGVALVCGTIVGLERQLRGKPLDVRTAVLICLGTHVFIRLGVELSGHNVDATRVLGQMVTGVGFLGAGVILTRGGHVVGLTTASVIWVLAGIGAAIGFGEYQGALALSIVVFLVLNVMEWVESRVEHMRRGVHQRNGDNEERRL